MAGDMRRRPRVQPLPERPVPKAQEVRRCLECGARLSVYNPGPNCWQHTIGRPWRGPSAKPRI